MSMSLACNCVTAAVASFCSVKTNWSTQAPVRASGTAVGSGGTVTSTGTVSMTVCGVPASPGTILVCSTTTVWMTVCGAGVGPQAANTIGAIITRATRIANFLLENI